MGKPTHLYKESEPKYNELYKIVKPILKDGDENLLAVLANCYIDYKSANDLINERALAIPGDKMLRKHPAYEIKRDMIKMIESLSLHFGLSPKSRKDNLKGNDESSDPLKDLMNDKS
jgi:P27 family predicted phage terminase small subunit